MSFDDIITKVKAHPELWQSSHPFYRHRVVSARTWKEIAAELKADDWIVVKKRWKHLKDTFRKELKKVTSNQIALSSWLHYNELQFLTEEITKKHKKQESDVSETESESEDKPLKAKKPPKRKRLEPSTMTSTIDTTAQSSIKFKKIMRSLNTLSKSMESSNNYIDDNLKNDTDYMFLVSLLPTMKNLSDIQRLHFRGKINNWLLNALLENEDPDACDNKIYVQAQINDANVQDCKLEIENNKS